MVVDVPPTSVEVLVNPLAVYITTTEVCKTSLCTPTFAITCVLQALPRLLLDKVDLSLQCTHTCWY